MTEHTEKKCPKCGQQLRLPKNVGGILMACPSCGEKFHSDFKIGGIRQSASRSGLFTTIFNLPDKILSHIGRLIFPK
jgi:DNA-directed RNA polymerase subunit RPC12/RpoP